MCNLTTEKKKQKKKKKNKKKTQLSIKKTNGSQLEKIKLIILLKTFVNDENDMLCNVHEGTSFLCYRIIGNKCESKSHIE